MSTQNQAVRAYIATPTNGKWAELMRVVAPFDPATTYQHGTLVSVGNELFRIVNAPRGQRARRFNRKGKRFNTNSLSLEQFKFYVAQRVVPDHDRAGYDESST